MNELLDTPTVPTDDTHTRARREQDRKVSNLIEEAETLIGAVQADPFVAEKLAGVGYDAARYAEGLELQKDLVVKFAARANAIGERRLAATVLNTRDENAREEYTAFRKVARTLFKSDQEHSRLSLHGDVPEDRQSFMAEAESSYLNASQEPFISVFKNYGYPLEKLQALQAALAEINRADEAQAAIINASKAATAERDAAAEDLAEWIRRLRNMTKVALKDHPGRLQILDI